MHVPDHFLDPQTSIATGVVALAGVGVALRSLKAERPADDRVPMAGLVATFVFAAQMINVQVVPGTSGHLIGAALAAVLVGPAAATICLSGVLVVQALLFADGGVTALGTNVTLMSLIAVVAGWACFRSTLAVLPRQAPSVPIAAAVGALVSVPVAAAAFAGLYAIGGQGYVGLGELMTAMVGWHALIGIGEAVATGLVVAAVVAARPDLVRGVRELRPRATVGAP